MYKQLLGISLTAVFVVLANPAFSLDESSKDSKDTKNTSSETSKSTPATTKSTPSTTKSTSSTTPAYTQTPTTVTTLTSTRNISIPTPEEDIIITDSIKKHLAESSIFSKFNINVSTVKGVVTLSGNVNSNNLASSLIELAQSIIGVRDVNSKLTVERSNQVLTDTVITAKIKGLFIREKLFGNAPGVDFMNVETKNGIVYLTGSINNKTEVDKALELIQGINGVKGVEYKFSKIIPLPPQTP